jgi:BirA family biotin operon repressor/biotin-[acetyl-CoA-carboxylase] ligase
MDEQRLAAAVDAPVVVEERIPNSSDLARQRGRAGAPHGTFVVAEELTAARGRDGSDWAAPPGGVWSSTLLRPDLDLETAGRLTIAGGLAARDAAAAAGVDARLKWPNDVVVVGDGGTRRKLAGVLTELVVDEVPVAGKPVEDAVPDADELGFAVLGIGINADLDPTDLGTDRAVTSLRAETGDAVDETAVAAALQAAVLDRVDGAATDEGFADLLAAYREHSATLGERIRVRTRDGERLVGDAVDLSETGALVVETDDGRRTVAEGEVERLRPA